MLEGRITGMDHGRAQCAICHVYVRACTCLGTLPRYLGTFVPLSSPQLPAAPTRCQRRIALPLAGPAPPRLPRLQEQAKLLPKAIFKCRDAPSAQAQVV